MEPTEVEEIKEMSMTLDNLKNRSTEELVQIFDDILADNLPEGKNVSDFTGGYIQQLSNSVTLICYIGYKEDGKNKEVARIKIDNEDIDMGYMLLKVKMNWFRNEKRKEPKKTISLSAKLIDTTNAWNGQ